MREYRDNNVHGVGWTGGSERGHGHRSIPGRLVLVMCVLEDIESVVQELSPLMMSCTGREYVCLKLDR